jgi:hypothetical protein
VVTSVWRVPEDDERPDGPPRSSVKSRQRAPGWARRGVRAPVRGRRCGGAVRHHRAPGGTRLRAGASRWGCAPGAAGSADLGRPYRAVRAARGGQIPRDRRGSNRGWRRAVAAPRGLLRGRERKAATAAHRSTGVRRLTARPPARARLEASRLPWSLRGPAEADLRSSDARDGSGANARLRWRRRRLRDPPRGHPLGHGRLLAPRPECDGSQQVCDRRARSDEP